MNYSRPNIWRLAKFLQAMFSNKNDWVVADQYGWYDMARAVHDEVYRANSPYVPQPVQYEGLYP